MYILCGRGLASHRWSRLTSNVRPHKTALRGSTKTNALRSPNLRSHRQHQRCRRPYIGTRWLVRRKRTRPLRSKVWLHIRSAVRCVGGRSIRPAQQHCSHLLCCCIHRVQQQVAGPEVHPASSLSGGRSHRSSTLSRRTGDLFVSALHPRSQGRHLRHGFGGEQSWLAKCRPQHEKSAA